MRLLLGLSEGDDDNEEFDARVLGGFPICLNRLAKRDGLVRIDLFSDGTIH